MPGQIATQLYQRFQQFVAEELIHDAQSGDMRAHTEIYKLFSQAVFTLAHGMCRNPQCAEDVLHNTFIKLIHKISTYKFQAPFGMWLRQIAVNEGLMHLRKQKKHRLTASIDAFDGFDDVQTHHTEFGKSATLEGATQRDSEMDINTILALLPNQVRTVLWLKEVEGYTHNEIAELLNKTPSYSKSVTARAFKFLREKIKQPELA